MMANATNSGRTAARNPHPPSYDTAPSSDPCLVHPGLVEHRLVSPTIQVQILAIVDATGTTSIGNIIAAFPGHEDPVGAIFALIAAQVLALLTPGIVDANSIVARADWSDPQRGNNVAVREPDAPPTEPADAALSLDAGNLPASFAELVEAALPAQLEAVSACPLQPRIIVGPGVCRTAFGRVHCLQRPGVYILLRGRDAYVGYGAEAGFRIIDGRQMPGGAPDDIIAIVDANDGLTPDDAKAYERILWSSVAADGELSLLNGVPDGAPIEPDRYDQLCLFNAQVALALRQAGLMFAGGSVRDLVAGPLAEPGRLGASPGIDELPDGQVMEVSYSDLTAFAAERKDGRWLLLAGSEVRIDTAASATSNASFQRAAWLHAGLLEPAEDRSCYVLKSDIVFPSPGTLGGFVSGSKGARASAWRPVGELDEISDTDARGPAL